MAKAIERPCVQCGKPMITHRQTDNPTCSEACRVRFKKTSGEMCITFNHVRLTVSDINPSIDRKALEAQLRTELGEELINMLESINPLEATILMESNS